MTPRTRRARERRQQRALEYATLFLAAGALAVGLVSITILGA